MNLLADLVGDYTLRTVALGSAALGLVSGALGTFAVLRRQSLLGDAVSHAALPGVVLAFMLTGAKTPLVLVLGAALTGWAAALAVMLVVRTTRLKMDTALGLLLSTFFGRYGFIRVRCDYRIDHGGNIFIIQRRDIIPLLFYPEKPQH